MFTSTSDLLTKSGLTAQAINNFLVGKGKMSATGDAFMAVEANNGINAIFGIAQAALETGWGKSKIAQDKNNLFGINAYDKNPYGLASSYATPEDCIAYWGKFMQKNYLTPGGVYFAGATPAGVARHYATDPEYSFKIVSLMNQIAKELGVSADAAPASAAPIDTGEAEEIYTVKKGDNMWRIAHDKGLTLQQLETLNPQAGHPAGNFALIWPNDKLVISVRSKAAPAPAPAEQTAE